jgi:ADP-ribosylation factor-like protein 1
LFEAKLVLLGSSGAGKTTLVKYLESGKPVEENVRTTLGIDVRSNPVRIENWEFSVIDIGGQTLYQKAFWNLGVSQADAIVYLIDGTIRPDNDKFKENLTQFKYMLNLIEAEMPILVLVNKQDLVNQNPMKPEEAAECYEINTLINRSLTLLATSAKFGEGVDIAMQWMIEKLAEIME